MKKTNYPIEDGFLNVEDFDRLVKSAKSYSGLVDLFGRIENPEKLKKIRKERLIKRLIKFSETYDEILMIKDFYAEALAYSLTDKQIVCLIEKLVWASTDSDQLKKVKDYARSTGFLNRYMKVFLNKSIAKAFMESAS